jgi:polyisoprenoid-binding protein YceI
MRFRSRSHAVAATTLTASILAVAATTIAGQQPAELGLGSGRVEIEGTSNIHPYTASTTVVRVKRATVALDPSTPDFLAAIVKPGALSAFEISVPVTSLASDKDGLNKNMHKALKADKHADISFRLTRLEPGAAGVVRATGVFAIAGVEREVRFDAAVQRSGTALSVKGAFPLLMTDYGITPPKAMLGMLKTDPKVTVKFDASFTIPAALVAGHN